MGRGSSKVAGGGGGATSKGAVTQQKYEQNVLNQVSNITSAVNHTTVKAVDARGNERRATWNRTPVYSPDQTTVRGYDYTVIYENRGVAPGSFFQQTFSNISLAKRFLKDMFEVD